MSEYGVLDLVLIKAAPVAFDAERHHPFSAQITDIEFTLRSALATTVILLFYIRASRDQFIYQPSPATHAPS